ncbi:hypothetical protein DYB26_001400 [Aphanomyces astaci]|uniref:Transmembrane protein n=1 Tax=Aphanomyces astaci TaxID=112090 RepID=A0A418G3Z7_APHAT|nr:hypothetical protein DYB26_001400 [Aphanomyces astaci]
MSIDEYEVPKTTSGGLRILAVPSLSCQSEGADYSNVLDTLHANFFATCRSLEDPDRSTIMDHDRGSMAFMTWETTGLLVQYALSGFAIGALDLFVHHRTPALAPLLSILSWTCSLLVGGLSDACHRRRRPFLVLGWLLCGTASVVVLALDDTISTNQPNNSTLSGIVGVAALVATAGMTTVTTAIEAWVVQLAQRESFVERGRLQSSAFAARYMLTAVSVQAFGWVSSSSPPSITPKSQLQPWDGRTVQTGYVMVAVVCVLAIVAGLRMRDQPFEQPNRLSLPFWHLARQSLFHLPLTWQVTAFWFCHSLCWPLVETPQVATIDTTSSTSYGVATGYHLCQALMVFGVGFAARQKSWRWTLALATGWLVVVTTVPELFSVWNVLRSTDFDGIMVVCSGLAHGAPPLLRGFVAVEMAGRGTEGLTVAMLAASATLSHPFHIAIRAAVATAFPNDQHSPESILVLGGIPMASLLLLVLLPAQKEHVCVLKQFVQAGCGAGGIAFTVLTTFVCAANVVLNVQTSIRLPNGR